MLCQYDKSPYLCNRKTGTSAAKRGRMTRKAHWTLSSAGSERLPYKQRVGGSNPSAPTGVFPVIHFCGCRDFFKGA